MKAIIFCLFLSTQFFSLYAAHYEKSEHLLEDITCAIHFESFNAFQKLSRAQQEAFLKKILIEFACIDEDSEGKVSSQFENFCTIGVFVIGAIGLGFGLFKIFQEVQRSSVRTQQLRDQLAREQTYTRVLQRLFDLGFHEASAALTGARDQGIFII